MVGNHLPDKGNVRFGDGTVAVSECLGHAWLSNRFLASSHVFFDDRKNPGERLRMRKFLLVFVEIDHVNTFLALTIIANSLLLRMTGLTEYITVRIGP